MPHPTVVVRLGSATLIDDVLRILDARRAEIVDPVAERERRRAGYFRTTCEKGVGVVRIGWPFAVVVGVMLTATGCGTGTGTAPESAARRFESALAVLDGRAACALLAPETVVKLEESAGKPCADAILEQDLPAEADTVRDVEQYGTAAVAHVGGETLFLGRFDGGWRVTAAGCTAVLDAPYSCTVEGS